MATRDKQPNAATETISGLHAVDEALAAGERVHRVVTTRAGADNARIKQLLSRAQLKHIPVTYEPEGWFSRLGAVGHQHIAAVVDAYQYASWSDVRQSVRSQPEPLIVAVDHIEDPQNIGAIVRNAEGAGALAVLIPERRSASITPAARRAAAGAASHIKIASVPNLVRALDELKADGCWVTGLSLEAEATPLHDADLSGKRVFVVGSEAKGLHRLVAEHCDALVRIPLLGKVGSLNAASAAAVVLFEAVRQRQTRGY